MSAPNPYAAVMARLAEYAPTAARFGSDVETSRVFSWRVPTGTAKPNVCLYIVNNPDVAEHMAGVGDLYKPTIQLDVMGDDFDAVRDAAQEVRDALRTMVGLYADVYVVRCFKDTDYDDIEEPSRGTEEPEFRVVLRYELWYKTRA